MAERDSWPIIRTRGLLSTAAILDASGIQGAQRAALESEHRPHKVTVQMNGTNVILRDQKPMAPDRLVQALPQGLSVNEWYMLLNGKVFMWAREERLLKLLNAREYRALEHDVLTLDTEPLVAAHRANIWLCHMNSGNTFPMPHQRDLTTFKRISDYPTRANGNPTKAVTEVVVDYQIADIRQYVLEVRRMRGSETLGTLPL